MVIFIHIWPNEMFFFVVCCRRIKALHVHVVTEAWAWLSYDICELSVGRHVEFQNMKNQQHEE